MDGEVDVERRDITALSGKWLPRTAAHIVAIACAMIYWTGQPAAAEQLASRAPVANEAGALSHSDPESCAHAYHTRLRRDVHPLTEDIWPTAIRVRKPDTTLPGYWLFWDGSGVLARTARQRRLLNNPQFLEREGRVCVHSILARGGRIRCLKWREVAENYKPPPPKPAAVEARRPEITDGERQLAAGVTRRVSSRGAIGELAFDTAFYHLIKRAADEIHRYAGQDFKARLCSGVPEMIAFYRKRLASLARRETEAMALATNAREAAEETFAAAVRVFDLHVDLGEGEAGRPLGLKDLVGAVLTAKETASLDAYDPDLELLARAREYLSDERFEALEKGRRGALRKALRTAEIALYAQINADRIGQLHAAFETSFDTIADAHRSSCVCGQ